MNDVWADAVAEVERKNAEDRKRSEEVERQEREDTARRLKDRSDQAAKTCMPAREDTPDTPLHMRKLPPQVIANLSPPVRTAGGELPAVDASLSEADRIRDPAARMARLEAEVAGLKRENSELKQRVAKLEEIQRRSLGAAYETEGEVYR